MCAILLFDIIKPIFTLVGHFFKILGSLLKLIFYLPLVSLTKVMFLISDGFKGIYLFIKGMFSGLAMVKKIIIPVAQTSIEHKENTYNVLTIFT